MHFYQHRCKCSFSTVPWIKWNVDKCNGDPLQGQLAGSSKLAACWFVYMCEATRECLLEKHKQMTQSRTRVIVCLIPHNLLPCHNLEPTLPTVQLDSWAGDSGALCFLQLMWVISLLHCFLPPHLRIFHSFIFHFSICQISCRSL